MGDISSETRAVVDKVRKEAVHTEGGCMLYYSNRGTPTSKVSSSGKRKQLVRLLYFSDRPVTEKEKHRRLRRRPFCAHKKCINPNHYQLACLQLKVYVTSFDPATLQDITGTLRISLC